MQKNSRTNILCVGMLSFLHMLLNRISSELDLRSYHRGAFTHIIVTITYAYGYKELEEINAIFYMDRVLYEIFEVR